MYNLFFKHNFILENILKAMKTIFYTKVVKTLSPIPYFWSPLHYKTVLFYTDLKNTHLIDSG